MENISHGKGRTGPSAHNLMRKDFYQGQQYVVTATIAAHTNDHQIMLTVVPDQRGWGQNLRLVKDLKKVELSYLGMETYAQRKENRSINLWLELRREPPYLALYFPHFFPTACVSI